MTGAGSKAWLDSCEIAGNADTGLWVEKEGDAILVACTFRDHAAGRAAGVFVTACARGKVAVGVRNVFERNEGGAVVRRRK